MKHWTFKRIAKTLLLITLFIILLGTCGASTIIDQRFSAVAPAGWTSTSSVWAFNRNETATGNYRSVVDATKYSARFASAANGNSIYVYIPINFKTDSIYTITFYTKRACSVNVNTNELPNQTTLLSNQSVTNASCTSNWNTWYEWSFTTQSTYTGTGYFQIWIKTVYGGPTSVYLDDVTITESAPKVLPIDLIYFTGHSDIDGNVIEWATMSEHNNNYFTIYRSFDGSNWYTVTEKNGAGNSSITSYYDITDPDSRAGVTYYQLKQTDFDGRDKIYPPISVYNNRTSKTVLRCTDLLGRECTANTGQLRIVEYTDGSKSIMVGNKF